MRVVGEFDAAIAPMSAQPPLTGLLTTIPPAVSADTSIAPKL